MTRQAQTATTGTTGEPSRRKAKTRRIRTTIRQVPFRLRDHRRKLHRYRHLLHPQREPLTGLLKDPVGRSLTPRGRDQLMAKAPAKTHGFTRVRARVRLQLESRLPATSGSKLPLHHRRAPITHSLSQVELRLVEFWARTFRNRESQDRRLIIPNK